MPSNLPAGTYAVFQTTLGDFTVKLFTDETPKTTANFISLAEGTKEFTDSATGACLPWGAGGTTAAISRTPGPRSWRICFRFRSGFRSHLLPRVAPVTKAARGAFRYNFCPTLPATS